MKQINLSSVVSELSKEIPSSVGRHDRFAGTSSDEKTTKFITDTFNDIGLKPNKQLIDFMGWSQLDEPSLEIIKPKNKKIRASLMTWSGSTSSEGVVGELFYVGKSRIISGLFYWDKYLVFGDDGFPKGQLIGISDEDWQHALPEPLERADYNLPSVLIGYNDNKNLKTTLEQETVIVKLKTKAKFLPQSETYNITADIKGTKFPDKYIIVSSHHDTVIDSPGASDNASGVACMLKLAEIFVNAPPSYSITFLSCAGEEWNCLGSRHYVRNLKERGLLTNIIANFNIDTVGHPEGKQMNFYCLKEDAFRIRRHLTSVLDTQNFTENKDYMWQEPTGGVDAWQFHINGIPTLTTIWWPFPTMHQHFESGFPVDKGINEVSMKQTVEVYKQLIESY